jgi:hypothetical protein
VNQASPDGTPMTGGEGQAPAAEGSGPSPDPTPQTPEEVEAIWRNRFSQRDRAHNAEVESLREQLDSARRSGEAPQGGESPADPQTASYKARLEQTQRELEEERQKSKVTERRLRFPELAREVPSDDPMWVAGRDETLARLNSTFQPNPVVSPTGHVDANNPSRQTLQPKLTSDMSKDELLAELKRLAPVVEAERGGF